MHMPTLHQVGDIAAYWTLGWSLVYALCPPRETFNSPGYDRFLNLVNYYGSLNIRSIVMKVYGAQPSDAPPIPGKTDTTTQGDK